MLASRGRSAVVIGSGIIGLTTAVSLLRAGLAVRVVSAEPIEATTSWKAAAVWFRRTRATPTGRPHGAAIPTQYSSGRPHAACLL